VFASDVWRSSDQGRNWYKLPNMPFPAPPGRSSGALLHFPSKQQGGKDILTYMGGYGRFANFSGITYYNDIYISTDRGAKWLMITNAAPWTTRDNFNSEVTRDGVIIVNAGFRDNGGDLNGHNKSRMQWTDRQHSVAAHSSLRCLTLARVFAAVV
jgi:hypothetical protein